MMDIVMVELNMMLRGNSEDVPICGGIDTCEATRTTEAIATFMCILPLFLGSLAILILGISGVFWMIRWLVTCW